MKRSRTPIPGLAILAALALASCGDDSPGRRDTSTDPESNRTTWLANGYDSYTYRFRWECFCTPDYVRKVDIVVIRGAVTTVTDAETGEPVDKESFDRYRTIDGLFEFIAEAEKEDPAALNVTWDPDLGYPVSLWVDYEEGVADEEMGFRVFEFAPLRQAQ